MITYETLKHSITIGEVLRRYGISAPDHTSYRIPCPIHRGRDSNFSVSERAGLWNCFSVCGIGGSVLDLVAALEKCSIPQAAKKLSEEFKVNIPVASLIAARRVNDQVERYRKMKENTEIELPPHRPLEEGYRGLTRETIKHFNLLRTDFGVLIPSVGNSGKVCSYAVRRDDGNPKYENAKGMSKAWPYGLWQNQHDIVHDGFTYVVEGQMDAVTMWQHGYRNVIAIQGSQISEQQAMLLLVLTSTLMLVMDGDLPGKKGADEINKKWGTVFKVGRIDLPDGIDPDEYLIKGGKL